MDSAAGKATNPSIRAKARQSRTNCPPSRLAFIASISCIFFASVHGAWGWDFPGQNYCPTTPPAVATHMTWRNYISLRWLPKDKSGNITGPIKSATFDVQFDHGKRFEDQKWVANSRPFPDVYLGACYTVSYEGNGKWLAAGWNKQKKGAEESYSSGRLPSQYKMNIWGHPFTFDDSGAVYYNKERIGSLVCNLSNNCNQFGDDTPPNSGCAGKIGCGTSTKYPLGHNSTLGNAAAQATKPIRVLKKALGL